MSKTTQRIVVLVFALALIIPMGLVGIGQLNKNDEPQQVPGAARDTRAPADPATQPKPTNTTAPNPATFTGMNEPTEAGAQASANHLFATYAYMIGTGETAQWEQASAPECQECLAFSAQSAGLHKQGGWVVGGDITLTDPKVTLGTVNSIPTPAKPAAKNPEGSGTAGNTPNPAADPAIAKQPAARIDSPYKEAQAAIVDNPKVEAQKREASQGKCSITMRHDGKRWLITSITVQ